MTTPLDRIFSELHHQDYETTVPRPGSSSWTSSLPLILCGPIVRKIHYDNASVWLAFKEEVTDIRLEVFDAINPSSRLLSGTVSRPLKLGNNLFITLVTAAGTRLPATRVYGYDVSFTHAG